VRGIETLATRALAWKAHFFFLSGISRYGDRKWPGPLPEGAAPGRLSVYGAHKRRGEAILEQLGTMGLRWTALAPPEIYGSHDRGGYVRFVYERVRSRRFVLLGRGENRWSVCNVRTVASAVVQLSDQDGAGVIHVADARPASQRELAEAVALALGRRAWFPRVPRAAALAAARINAAIPRRAGAPPAFAPAHVLVRTSTMVLDTSRAAALMLGPGPGLDEGVAEAVAWWERRRA
jgi:nucleoside-diphosphate-sugar epimerase